MDYFENIENFVEWLKNTAKNFTIERLCEWLDDLQDNHSTRGDAQWELEAWETLSGHPETYHYTTRETFFLDGRELTEEEVNAGSEWDEFNRTFIF